MNRSRTDATPVRVAIVEDDAEIRGALELLISGTSGYACVGAFGDCESAITAFAVATEGDDGSPEGVSQRVVSQMLNRERYSTVESETGPSAQRSDEAAHGSDGVARDSDALPLEASAPVDVLLMDISLPGMSGIEGVRLLRERFPALDIIMLTVHDDDRSVFDSLCAGACGYLVKTTHPTKILAAIEEVHRGGAPMSPAIARMVASSFRRSANSPLTPRETEILQQVCVGKSYKMIAAELFISQETVHSHLKNIYRKLEVSSKTEAMAKAFRERWI